VNDQRTPAERATDEWWDDQLQPYAWAKLIVAIGPGRARKRVVNRLLEAGFPDDFPQAIDQINARLIWLSEVELRA